MSDQVNLNIGGNVSTGGGNVAGRDITINNTYNLGGGQNPPPDNGTRMVSSNPCEWSGNYLQNLRDVLADLYFEMGQARMMAKEAGLNVGLISFHPSSVVNWFNILSFACNAGKLEAVIDRALKDYATNAVLQQAKAGALDSTRGTDIRKTAWQEPVSADQLEKLMGAQSTLLPIRFLQKGQDYARAVVRIAGPLGLGTGFLVANNILITNHHVIENAEQARVAVAQFNYQENANGLPDVSEEVKLEPDRFFRTSEQHDWTAVAVKGDMNAKWGAIPMQRLPANPKKDDFTIIIQHPGGRMKQIALYHNVVTAADDNVVQYLTDTEPGSSGAPVFDTQWRLIALHHSGGWLREPGTKLSVYRNEGININRVIEGINQ
ncbi:MAG: serine protease [Anaerolineae bacterium]|nr:serine protease [Anaerolineae bacterium]